MSERPMKIVYHSLYLVVDLLSMFRVCGDSIKPGLWHIESLTIVIPIAYSLQRTITVLITCTIFR